MDIQSAIIEGSMSNMVPQLQTYYTHMEDIANTIEISMAPPIFSDYALEAVDFGLKKYQERFERMMESLNHFAESMAFTQEELAS